MPSEQSQYYKAIRKQIAGAVSQGKSKEDVVWAFVEGASAVVDGVTDTCWGGVTGGSLQLISDLIKHQGGSELAPNPWFVFNGHDDATSPYTTKYLRNRSRKGIAGGLIGIGGSLGSQVTQVDVAGIMQHGNAVGSTSAHLVKLRALAQGYKQSETLTGWVDLLIKMKALKAGVRGTQLVGASIPVGAVGIATGLGAAAAKLGIKFTLTNACLIAAVDIHWRAYQEQAISGGLLGKTGKVGPASNMLYEIFSRRGVTRIFGKYDVDKIIHEPSGWMAVSDKLLLI